MPTEVDLQEMTDAEIKALATRCLDSLNLAERIQAVLAAFHNEEEREELTQWIQTEAEEDEDLGGDEPE